MSGLRAGFIVCACLVAAHSSVVSAGTEEEQGRTGNIVEYFGRDRVDVAEEGEVVHVFREGLLLPGTGMRGSRQGTTPVDAVFSRFLFDPPPKERIAAGEPFDADAFGSPIVWQTISAGERSTFEDRRLRGGVLHLSYTSEVDRTVLFEASGHTRVLIDGRPREGDHYDYGWTLIPLRLQAGRHEFVLRGGRFGRMRARLLEPSTPVRFTLRDPTLPDVRFEDRVEHLGAVRVINATTQDWRGGKILCEARGKLAESTLPSIARLHVRKVPFRIPYPEDLKESDGTVEYDLSLVDGSGKTVSTARIELAVRSKFRHHKRTFVSDIDGSVQYFSVAPATDRELEQPALFLSVHGASVEATNQAAAYKQKTWGHLVAPTNRRPFGFAWEDWGRLDALEVLAEAEKIYRTDRSRTYLTGHSMGGHGTWYLGATYPGRFAAIAPCAGYPDLLEYRGGFLKRIETLSAEQRKRFGVTDRLIARLRRANEASTPFDEIVARAGNSSRTLKLIDNYAQLGVYVLHGEKDTVVPTDIARDMRKRLGEFHRDFAYYEYPGGSHWYGNHSVDWGPIFDFFEARTLQASREIGRLAFRTASPGVSARNRFLTVVQQETLSEISSVDFEREKDGATVTTENVSVLALDIEDMGLDSEQSLEVDGQSMEFSTEDTKLYVSKKDEKWTRLEGAPRLREKGPHRNGGFKDAFRNRVVLIYATNGTPLENEWYYNRARFDAEKFWYRGNGSVDLIADNEFDPSEHPNRNVVLYGNATNNRTWEKLLKDCPLQVREGALHLGEIRLDGTSWGAYFVYPRPDSDTATIGVVTASGAEGMKAAYANHYLVNGTNFADVMIFDDRFLTYGAQALKCVGFWGNDWSVSAGDFVWR